MKTEFLILIIACFAIVQSTFAAKHSMDELHNPSTSLNFIEDASAPKEPLTLWYKKPAKKWETEALPVGNGRLGAMVFGGVDKERIQFNEETVWDGEYIDRHNPSALEALPKVQKLLFEGKNGEATNLAGKTMLGIPSRVKSYQTLGDLLFDFAEVETVSGYRRELNLTTGISKVNYTLDGVNYTREVFASAPGQVIVIHMTADRSKKISFRARFDRRDMTTCHGNR